MKEYDSNENPMVFILDNKLKDTGDCPSCDEYLTSIKTKDICCDVEVCEKCMYISHSCGIEGDETKSHFRIDEAQLKSILKHKQ